jgi:hypothetical protein
MNDQYWIHIDARGRESHFAVKPTDPPTLPIHVEETYDEVLTPTASKYLEGLVTTWGGWVRHYSQ